jgi:hypothetical protein
LAVGTAGAVTVAGQSVTLTAEINLTLEIDVSGLVSVAGQEVGLNVGGLAAETRQAGGGKSRKRRKYQVEIDGEVFDVATVEEAKELLQEAESLAAKKADEQLEKASEAKKPRRKVVQDARKALKLPEIRVVGSDTDPAAAAIEQEMRQSFDRISKQYAEAVRAIEIGAFLRRNQQEEEDDAIVTLLMTL